MIVTRVETVALRLPIALPLYRGEGEAGSRIFWGGRRRRFTPRRPEPGLDYVVVRIETDDGVTGVGETQPDIAFFGQTVEQVRLHIDDYIGPRLVGADPLRRTHLLHLVDYPSNSCALAAVDMALHDLAGKALGASLGTLLGGVQRDRIAVAVEIAGAAPEEMAAACSELQARGVGAFKAKIGGHPEADAERLSAMRAAIGPGAVLRADANQGYTVKQAVRLCRLAERDQVGLELLEQPVAGGDLQGLAAVRRAVDVPIEADESCFTVQDALDVIRHEAADVLNVKLGKAGGIANGTRIATLAEAAGLGVVLGTSFGLGLEVAAKLQLAACTLGLAGAVEVTELAYHGNLLAPPDDAGLALPADGGTLAVPGGPGLGVALAEGELAQFLV